MGRERRVQACGGMCRCVLAETIRGEGEACAGVRRHVQVCAKTPIMADCQVCRRRSVQACAGMRRHVQVCAKPPFMADCQVCRQRSVQACECLQRGGYPFRQALIRL